MRLRTGSSWVSDGHGHEKEGIAAAFEVGRISVPLDQGVIVDRHPQGEGLKVLVLRALGGVVRVRDVAHRFDLPARLDVAL